MPFALRPLLRSLVFVTGILACFNNSICEGSLTGIACAKLDLAPTYLHIDVLEEGKEIKNLDMYGGRFDGAFILDWGPYLKLNAMAATHDGFIDVFGGAVGFWVPLHRCIFITPLAGINYSYFTTKAPIRALEALLGEESPDFKQQIRSRCPYLGFEISINLDCGWRFAFSYNWAWCASRTTIREIGLKNHKNESKGPTYALFLEKDIDAHWSVNGAWGWNESLSHEKHGLRGYGGKLGVSYWFCGR